MKGLTCAFTGHRPNSFPWKYNESDSECAALKAVLAEQIKLLADTVKVTEFLSGMALGVDTWAAKDVLMLRKHNPNIKLHCVLPCKSQADRWKIMARLRYNSILRQADTTYYISQAYTQTCMMERNRYLVDHSDILLAVYNGQPQGGTAATVHYALRTRQRVIIIDPVTRQIKQL